MLKMALKECRKIGLEMVLVTCIRGNEGSRGVIMNNGGIYESTVFEKSRGLHLERYWIDIS
jgi:predicted acetyltransferase